MCLLISRSCNSRTHSLLTLTNHVWILFIHIFAVPWTFSHLLNFLRANIMIMSHRKLIVHMQIANQASLIHRPTSFTQELFRDHREFLYLSLSLSLYGEQRSHLIMVTYGWMRDIVIVTSSSKPLITEQVFIFIYLKKKVGGEEKREREREFFIYLMIWRACSVHSWRLSCSSFLSCLSSKWKRSWTEGYPADSYYRNIL